jgi:hypothetical protein
MDDMKLYIELVDYIYCHCTGFMTETEKLARKSFLIYQPDLSEKRLRIYQKVGWISEEKKVKELMVNGFAYFKEKVATRIFDEHKEELELNLCPKCQKIARTPEAKQCRFCFHAWREKPGKENES